MEKEYDVLVVGGGPAGLIAARVASGCGADVLLLEKKSYLGSPFARTMWDSPYMRRVFKMIGTSSIRCEVRGHRTYDFSGENYIDIPAKGWGGHHVDAVRFCQGLARLAAEEGAQMEVGSKVLGFLQDGDRVVGARTSKKKYRARVVLCADGLASVYVGLAGNWLVNQHSDMLTSGLNTELVGVVDIEPGWQESHPIGMSWGLGRQILLPLDEGFCGASFKSLDYFRQVRMGSSTLSRKMRNAQIAKRFASVDRKMRGYPFPQVAFDGLLFCGEAAGNHYALHCMISADMAAQVAAVAALENDVMRERLVEYEHRFEKSDISKVPGRPPAVPSEVFNLEEHCSEVLAQKVAMSKIDI